MSQERSTHLVRNTAGVRDATGQWSSPITEVVLVYSPVFVLVPSTTGKLGKRANRSRSGSRMSGVLLNTLSCGRRRRLHRSTSFYTCTCDVEWGHWTTSDNQIKATYQVSSVTFCRRTTHLCEYLTSDTSWNTRNHPGWAPSQAVYLTGRDDFLHGGARFHFPRFSGNSLSASDVFKLGTVRGTLHSTLTATWGSSLQELLERAKTTGWPFSGTPGPSSKDQCG